MDENEELNEQEEEVINIIPTEDLAETDSVIPEDDTLAAVEPYREKFDELEDLNDELIEIQETAQDDGDQLLADETQTYLNILDNKENYYACLTDIPDANNIESGEGVEPEEPVNVIPVEELIETGSIIPEGDTLSEIDKDRKTEDIIDFITISDAGGADPSMEPFNETIDDDDQPIICIENDKTSPFESQLRKDEIMRMMNDVEENEEEEEEEDISSKNFIHKDYGR